MSWWVMEQVSVNEAGTQTLANIQCDNVSDLPAPDQSATLGYIIVRGSQAKVLATSEKYILGSAGAWVKMEDGVKLDLTGYATTQDLSDGLAAKVDTTAYEAGQAEQETEIGVVAAMGAKNLFPITAISQTVGGVTFTVNGDGTITANGTKTNNDWFILSENNSFDAGTYTLSDGLPEDTTGCRLIISTARSMSAAIMLTGTGVRTQTKNFTTAQTGLYYAIRIESGVTVNNLTFKPMIRRAEITDSTYAPYAPTNRELYEKIETDVVSHELVVPTGSIFDYVNGLKAGFYTARQGSSVGTGKPLSNGAFAYLIFVFSAGTAQITAFEAVVSGASATPDIFTVLKSNGVWGAWRRFTGEAVASTQSAPASLMQAGRID